MICEYATKHSDETFSVVRGGIARWTLPQVPTGVSFALLLIIPPHTLTLGEHDLEFRLTTASGTTAWTNEGRASVRDARFSIHGTARLDATIDAFGPAIVEVTCSGARGHALLDFQESEP